MTDSGRISVFECFPETQALKKAKSPGGLVDLMKDQLPHNPKLAEAIDRIRRGEPDVEYTRHLLIESISMLPLDLLRQTISLVIEAMDEIIKEYPDSKRIFKKDILEKSELIKGYSLPNFPDMKIPDSIMNVLIFEPFL